MATEQHFTATVEVTKTSIGVSDPVRTSRVDGKPLDRAVQQVAHIVVRADTLEKLVTKLTEHVALVTE